MIVQLIAEALGISQSPLEAQLAFGTASGFGYLMHLSVQTAFAGFRFWA